MTYLFSNLIYILISGFLISHAIPLTRYNMKDKNGYYFVLATFVMGLAVYVFTYLIQSWSWDIPSQINKGLQSLILKSDSNTVTNTSVSAFVITLFISLIVNVVRLLNINNRLIINFRMFSLNMAYKSRGSKALLIKNCFLSARPVLVCLKSRKSYVGYIYEIPYFDDKIDWNIKLLPLRSGYRDKDNLHLTLNNNYEQFWTEAEDSNFQDGLNVNNLGIVLNWDDIETLSEWIPEIYDGFNSD